MILFNVFNQLVHYWLAETLCCCELTQHEVILFIVLPFPFQICKVTMHQSPAAVSLAVFSLSFYFPKGDCFKQVSGLLFLRIIFFFILNNIRPPKLFSVSLPHTAENLWKDFNFFLFFQRPPPISSGSSPPQ